MVLFDNLVLFCFFRLDLLLLANLAHEETLLNTLLRLEIDKCLLQQNLKLLRATKAKKISNSIQADTLLSFAPNLVPSSYFDEFFCKTLIRAFLFLPQQREVNRCYALPKGDLEEVEIRFPKSN